MAVITDAFKRVFIDNIKADFDSSGTYYHVGVSRAEIWNDSDIVPDETRSYRQEALFRHSLQSIKSVTDVSLVVPRYNWSSGTIYRAWDDNYTDYPTNGYYVMNSSSQVYICIEQGKTATGAAATSVVEPTGTSTSAFTTADGYTWKYLYQISSFEASRFLSAEWIPIKYIDSATSGDIRAQLQELVQDAAVNGQVANIVITNGGSGYTTAPTITINGDGSGATATATISGGAVVKISMTARGSGYSYANVSFSSGTATARAVLSPAGGFGADPRTDLKADAIMYNSRPSDDEGGTWLLDQDFRQIGLFRNIKKTTDSDYTGASALCLGKLTFEPGATLFSIDNYIVGETSGAKGYIDYVDSTAYVLYHQNEDTGFKSFTSGENLTSENLSGSVVSGSAVLDSDIPSTINKYSGDLLYIDNRSAVTRSANETQDLKLVIQL